MQEDHSGRSGGAQEEGAPRADEQRPAGSDAGSPAAGEPVQLPGGGVMGGSTPEPQPALEVSFGDLVRPFLMMGLTGVGVLPHPDTGQPALDLSATRHAIATLELLKERTEGQRSEEENSMLEQALFELKMQFVEAQGRSDRK